MILAIPHDGHEIPEEYADFCGPVTYMGDFGAHFIYDNDSDVIVSCDVDRIICDVERYEDSTKEEMEKIGMGICYTHNADGVLFHRITKQRRQEVIEKYYRKYHHTLADAVERELDERGKSTIIDCHTFSATPRGYETDKIRPQVCVGFQRDMPASATLAEQAVRHFCDYGYNTIENRPFSGAIRPLWAIGDDRVRSIMLEIRQDMITSSMRKDVQAFFDIRRNQR